MPRHQDDRGVGGVPRHSLRGGLPGDVSRPVSLLAQLKQLAIQGGVALILQLSSPVWLPSQRRQQRGCPESSRLLPAAGGGATGGSAARPGG